MDISHADTVLKGRAKTVSYLAAWPADVYNVLLVEGLHMPICMLAHTKKLLMSFYSCYFRTAQIHLLNLSLAV